MTLPRATNSTYHLTLGQYVSFKITSVSLLLSLTYLGKKGEHCRKQVWNGQRPAGGDTAELGLRPGLPHQCSFHWMALKAMSLHCFTAGEWKDLILYLHEFLCPGKLTSPSTKWCS